MLSSKSETTAKFGRSERVYVFVGIGATALVVSGLALLIYYTWK